MFYGFDFIGRSLLLIIVQLRSCKICLVVIVFGSLYFTVSNFNFFEEVSEK
jgi:hypothetical protein